MQRFEFGQEITLRIGFHESTRKILKIGEVYTVIGYDVVPDIWGSEYLFLAEIPNKYIQEAFEPLVSDEVLEKELNQIPERTFIYQYLLNLVYPLKKKF